ncbi:MAG: CvpA family protein [Lachnospiraceae bacterium]|nr:CvpA family protein [Lachnospiraceae bacterium]
MNWLSIGVLAVFALFMILGYRKGFVKMAYSLVAVIISIALVSAITPYVKEALLKNTTLYDKLTERCVEALEKKDNDKKEKEKEEKLDKEEPALPTAVKAITGELTKNKLAEGLKKRTGEAMAMWILCVIAFVGSLIIVWLLLNFVEGALDLVTKLPVLHGTNQLLGAAAGLVHGLLLLWIACIVLTALCLEDSCGIIFRQIEESPYLSFLYENNGIIYLASYFLL